jgi:hypothetical protein
MYLFSRFGIEQTANFRMLGLRKKSGSPAAVSLKLRIGSKLNRSKAAKSQFQQQYEREMKPNSYDEDLKMKNKLFLLMFPRLNPRNIPNDKKL